MKTIAMTEQLQGIIPGTSAELMVQRLLVGAGVQVNGGKPWDIRIHDKRFFRRVLLEGPLGLGESYVEGWWDCDRLDLLFERLVAARLDEVEGHTFRLFWWWFRNWLFNLQTEKRAKQVALRHYDLGNDLFERMLDKRMTYSCAYFCDDVDLNAAQEAKLDLICRKLELQPGMKVLDIGCGWGAFAVFAAERFGVDVTGVTISREQFDFARERFSDLSIKWLLCDYRTVQGEFDRVVSVGMFEHVGARNYRVFVETVSRLLRRDGIALLHTIGKNLRGCSVDPWIGKYIFPNSHLPSPGEISRELEGMFVIEDWHNLGPHYYQTLVEWHKNFANSWLEIAHRYGEQFFRMWQYYLLSCAGAFRARGLQVWQLVLTKPGRTQPNVRVYR